MGRVGKRLRGEAKGALLNGINLSVSPRRLTSRVPVSRPLTPRRSSPGSLRQSWGWLKSNVFGHPALTTFFVHLLREARITRRDGETILRDRHLRPPRESPHEPTAMECSHQGSFGLLIVHTMRLFELSSTAARI